MRKKLASCRQSLIGDVRILSRSQARMKELSGESSDYLQGRHPSGHRVQGVPCETVCSDESLHGDQDGDKQISYSVKVVSGRTITFTASCFRCSATLNK